MKVNAPAPFAPEETLGHALIAPTRIYVRSVLAVHRAGLLKAAAHITGGGLAANLARVLPDKAAATLRLSWPIPRVVGWIAHAMEQQATGRLIRPQSRYVGPSYDLAG